METGTLIKKSRASLLSVLIKSEVSFKCELLLNSWSILRKGSTTNNNLNHSCIWNFAKFTLNNAHFLELFQQFQETQFLVKKTSDAAVLGVWFPIFYDYNWSSVIWKFSKTNRSRSRLVKSVCFPHFYHLPS